MRMVQIKKLRIKELVLLLVAVGIFISGNLSFYAKADTNVTSVWWPANSTYITGTQPFKASLAGATPESYEMFWQVDGGQWNWMDNNYQDAPHKEASVDVSGWNWKGNGPYTLNFIARKNGTVLSERSVQIYIGSNTTPVAQVVVPVSLPTTPVLIGTSTTPIALPVVLPTPVAAPITPVTPVVVQNSAPTSYNALEEISLYTKKYSPAAEQASAWRNSRPNDAAFMDILAAQPGASWFGNWNSDIYKDVKGLVDEAARVGKSPVLVAYNIPARDCGGYSAGGANSPSGYRSWIGSFAAAIGTNKAVVILEPDALASMNCLSAQDKQTRVSLIAEAVRTLKQNTNTKVYIDAGHSGWNDVAVIADLLRSAGVSQANGFALNVSNFNPTNTEVEYGSKISAALGSAHFVVDTSRNGNGSDDGAWCNPSGRATGIKPTTNTGNSLVDAYLWVKTPGESDGTCNGGPSAGSWWADYALGLIQKGK